MQLDLCWEDNLASKCKFYNFIMFQHVSANIVVLISLWSETSHLLQACSWRLCNLLLIKNHELLNLMSIIADLIIWESSHGALRSQYCGEIMALHKKIVLKMCWHQQTYSLLKCCHCLLLELLLFILHTIILAEWRSNRYNTVENELCISNRFATLSTVGSPLARSLVRQVECKKCFC